MGGVLRYKWEACCGTNGRCIAAFGLEASKAQRYKWGGRTVVQIGGVLPVLFRQVVRVEGSFNKLKTTPTPNKNGSYGIKWGVRMPYFGGPYAIFSVELP